MYERPDDLIDQDIKDIEKQVGRNPSPEAKEDPKEEKKDTIKLLILIGVVVVLFAIFFSVSYYKNQSPEIEELPTVEYNGFEFVYYVDMWNSRWQSGDKVYNTHFHFNPLEVKNVTLVGELDERFSTTPKYVTFDPEGDDLVYVAWAVGELDLSLVKVFNQQVIAACSKNVTEPCFTRPIINCSNTDSPVIYLRSADETKVTYDGNCMIIEGKEKELLRAVDRVLFQWYKIL